LILDKYLLIVEYAEGGSLNNYLKTNFPSLNWRDKYKLALQLSSAIEYLHERGIVHKGLHSRSVLIQQNSIRLADSGLSRRIKDVCQISLNLPYTDPRGIDIEENESEKCELDEKSDVYSIGVLLWELSSGKTPFTDKKYDSILAMAIARGLREVIVEGTPTEYCILYGSK
jgi:serine/threonine protein kinase